MPSDPRARLLLRLQPCANRSSSPTRASSNNRSARAPTRRPKLPSTSAATTRPSPRLSASAVTTSTTSPPPPLPPAPKVNCSPPMPPSACACTHDLACRSPLARAHRHAAAAAGPQRSASGCRRASPSRGARRGGSRGRRCRRPCKPAHRRRLERIFLRDALLVVAHVAQQVHGLARDADGRRVAATYRHQHVSAMRRSRASVMVDSASGTPSPTDALAVLEVAARRAG